ncbi:uncharacterized protein MKK02DRAFT_32310 [Dioszegia hungarica]|uniref:Uncharacterized protein n=1 Tax=Dioszegia hungarica TaxID=4972 RepID=A0AA38LXJ4_9TREE|nr:uncharacterized protein MKK02DRAFT_32310 [Dioszegia hungarica]KAI9637471.1 hypothetical protein MKK02DRAFT_32310 [Dioszegia hungarica]
MSHEGDAARAFLRRPLSLIFHRLTRLQELATYESSPLITSTMSDASDALDPFEIVHTTVMDRAKAKTFLEHSRRIKTLIQRLREDSTLLDDDQPLLCPPADDRSVEMFRELESEIAGAQSQITALFNRKIAQDDLRMLTQVPQSHPWLETACAWLSSHGGSERSKLFPMVMAETISRLDLLDTQLANIAVDHRDGSYPRNCTSCSRGFSCRPELWQRAVALELSLRSASAVSRSLRGDDTDLAKLLGLSQSQAAGKMTIARRAGGQGKQGAETAADDD